MHKNALLIRASIAHVCAGLACAAMLASTPASAGPVVNGDFEAGNVGFSSAYVHAPGATAGSSNLGAAQYVVTTNPAVHHGLGRNFGDHTTGTGSMLMANAAGDRRIVWSQTVAVAPGTDYFFSAWAANWLNITDPSPARLSFEVDGVPLGVLSLTGESGVWESFGAGFNSGLRSSLLLGIRDLNTAGSGNDFALDDIALNVPEPGALALLAAGLFGLRCQRRRRG